MFRDLFSLMGLQMNQTAMEKALGLQKIRSLQLYLRLKKWKNRNV